MKRSSSSKILALFSVLLFATWFSPLLETSSKSVSLEDGWVAHPLYATQLIGPMAAGTPYGYSPNQTKAAYGLPFSGGAGTTIAIIDAYDTPTIWQDLGNFSDYFGLPAPTSSNFEVHKMASNLEVNSSWAQETSLDVEWAHAIAPDAKILLVEAEDAGNGLIAAVDYARGRPDVVAVSMSWGGSEWQYEYLLDYHFTSNYGAVFFASSGDDGAGTLWPACSSNVVAVGGTTLTLNYSDGSVISETAWSGSAGGVSQYENRPSYQTNYGLNWTKRAVPDVSYNGNPTTGFPIFFNSTWFPGKIGGTSAGAPQWAAIYALGLSATNTNFYADAKSPDYSSYFRDIISGSNGYQAGTGYDLVTGLGSPLTDDFSVPTPTPTPSPTPTIAPTSSPTPTASPTPSPTPTPTATPSPTPTLTQTPTPTPTPTITPTPTSSPTPTSTPTQTATPTNSPTPTPTPQPLPTPNLSFYCISSTTYSGFNIQIQGSLTHNDVALPAAGIQLSYSVTGGASWQNLTYVTTGNNGNFACTWIPSVSGIYVVKAEWPGSTEYSNASATYNFAVESFNNQNQNIFSVTSNSTLTSLAFNSATNELSFDVSGTPETTGLTVVCIPQSLIPDISKLTVKLDTDIIGYIVGSNDNVWIVTFTYNHSSHTITMELGSSPTPTQTYAPTTYPTPSPKPTPNTATTSTPTPRPTTSPAPTPQVPESSFQMIIALLALATYATAIYKKQKRH